MTLVTHSLIRHSSLSFTESLPIWLKRWMYMTVCWRDLRSISLSILFILSNALIFLNLASVCQIEEALDIMSESQIVLFGAWGWMEWKKVSAQLWLIIGKRVDMIWIVLHRELTLYMFSNFAYILFFVVLRQEKELNLKWRLKFMFSLPLGSGMKNFWKSQLERDCKLRIKKGSNRKAVEGGSDIHKFFHVSFFPFEDRYLKYCFTDQHFSSIIFSTPVMAFVNFFALFFLLYRSELRR